MKLFLLQIYRFGVVAVIAWLIRDLAVQQRTQGDSPVQVEEVAAIYPEAKSLRPDDSLRDGLFVLDRTGGELGYIVRTQPQCQGIIGYAGITDALVLMDRDWKILGISIHGSEDTLDYVKNISVDRRFLKKWNGLSWGAAAELDLQKAGIEGVSGATMTSMAIARSVKARLQLTQNEMIGAPGWAVSWRDAGMLIVVGLAGVMAFGPSERRQRWKRPFQVILVVYVGLLAGDLVAVKLLAGWNRSGVPITTAPGLVLLTAAALIVPWATRKPFYCHHVCPHGAAQELIGALRPKRWQWSLSPGVVRGLEYLPFGLLLFVAVVALLALPFDLAAVEPFAAYVLPSAGGATLVVAVVGLIAAFFVPQAYCRFGCPTGALLNFVRARGETDRFSRRDAAALVLTVITAGVHGSYLPLMAWLKGIP